jgi:hypothetical protein
MLEVHGFKPLSPVLMNDLMQLLGAAASNGLVPVVVGW